MQNDINLITAWLLQNELTINSKKTKLMIIKHGQQNEQNVDFQIQIEQQIVERVDSFKYLGITIQDNLKWGSQIDKMCGKIAGISSVIRRLGNKISNKARISFYYSMINS